MGACGAGVGATMTLPMDIRMAPTQGDGLVLYLPVWYHHGKLVRAGSLPRLVGPYAGGGRGVLPVVCFDAEEAL